MTVGAVKPVICTTCEISKATSTSSLSASLVTPPTKAGLFSYFSRYMRTVAPLPAVPERRKTTREPSTMRMRMPWLGEMLPSIGSM